MCCVSGIFPASPHRSTLTQMSDMQQNPTNDGPEGTRSSGVPAPDVQSAATPARTNGPGGIRASDSEREEVVAQLAEHATTGRLTLAELDERMTDAFAATTRGELDRIVADLPSVGGDARSASARVVPPTPDRKASRWLVGVMGGSDRHGRWRVADRLNVVAVMGGHTVDLREAELTSQETTIVVVSVMGGSDILVPESVDVSVGGLSIMGGNGEYGVTRSPAPGSPRVRILAYNIMGGSDIWRVPEAASGMSVRQAKKYIKKHQRD